MASTFTIGTGVTSCGVIRNGNYVFNSGGDIIYLGSDPNSASSGGGVVLSPATAVQWENDGYLYASCPAGTNPILYLYRDGEGTPGVIPFSSGEQIIPTGLHSAGYQAGVSGWRIGKDGSAEFNSGTFRGSVGVGGTFTGINFVINQHGMFVYSTTPAAGKLIMSVSGDGPGTDPYGNTYPKGTQLVSGIASLLPDDNAFDTPGFLEAIYNGAGTAHAGLIIQSPFSSAGGQQPSAMQLFSTDANGLIITEIDADRVDFSGVTAKKGEAWVDPANSGQYNTNWSGGTTYNTLTGLPTLKYKLTADGFVHLQGAFKAGAVAPGAAVMTFAQTIYRPNTAQVVGPVFRNNGGTLSDGFAIVTTGGNVDLFGTGGVGVAANNEYVICGSYPISNQ